ncbi:MAG: tetratricopeptide repeat protein [Acidithiobacillales bacterium]
MRRGLLCIAALGVALIAAGVRAQEASESYEREAKKEFDQGHFSQSAVKFGLAAEAAAEGTRRARMYLQEAWSHFNARNPKEARDALKSAFELNADLKVIPDFFSPDFMKMVEEVRLAARAAAEAPKVNIAETLRMSRERLKDGHVDEVIHDLTYNIPPDKLGREGSEILAEALERKGRFTEAARVRAAAGIGTAPTAPPSSAPAPSPKAAAPAPVPTPAAPAPASTPAPARPGGGPIDYLVLGRQALLRGDTSNAMAAANRQLELDPNSSEAYRLLAEVNIQRGEKVMAEALLKQSLKYNERNEATLLLLYDFYAGEKDWKDALDALRRATEVNPANRDRMVAIGRKFRSAGDLGRAAQVFASAAEALPGDAALLTEYGAILRAEGKPDAALDPLMKAVTAAPDREVVRANLAAVLRERNQFREAEREYREALRCDPDYVPALVGLGTLLLQRQSLADAVAPLKKAVTLDPKNADAVWALVRALRLAGQTKEASETLEHAVELGTPEIWNEAGVFAAERRKLDEAAQDFARAAEKAPDVPVYRTNLDRAASLSKFLKDAGLSLAR